MTDYPDRPRLIEAAFPLKQASIDSVHEKNVRHGHISTLHIWPARRPLAACRAALIATLLPDPGTPEERKKLVEKIGGTVVTGVKKKKMPSGRIEEIPTEQTLGGVLHWGRESSPDMDWFRAKIREAYGGRAPKVLDPFAGGGAIPLEAMRLGCEVTAIDINPVAWFILKCTLEYPQMLAGQKRPLPDFILKDREFMEEFFKAQGFKGAMLRSQLTKLGLDDTPSPLLTGMGPQSSTLEADLAWHVRAWGRWVLNRARADLAPFYPSYADFQPTVGSMPDHQRREPRLVPLDANGARAIASLNAEFSKEYLTEGRNPRWIQKPTVAYLWARTVICKHCRATLPLLKTRWLSRTDSSRMILTTSPTTNRTGVEFGVEEAPAVGLNAAQRREHDKRIGVGTLSRSGATCPCCGGINTLEDIKIQGMTNGLGSTITAVIIAGTNRRLYRPPTSLELEVAADAASRLVETFASVPFGVPVEPLPSKEALGFRVPLYGFDRWDKLYTDRQLLAIGAFLNSTRIVAAATTKFRYSMDWSEAISAYLACALSRLVDRGSTLCTWVPSRETIGHTFARFVLPITWDFAESVPPEDSSGGYPGAVEWVAQFLSHGLAIDGDIPEPRVLAGSATFAIPGDLRYDVVITDPPYYDAIPYSDLMDYFYVWLRRCLVGSSRDFDAAFAASLAPKWDHERDDGELIDDSSRFGGDQARSKVAYENGMARVFEACNVALNDDGRFVLVFAHKHPDAWETLVSATIRAGFIVEGSWPIQTERETRTRSLSSAALSSSIWLVCKKRPETARPGWDNRVLDEMREKITTQLREFWDAGIRGPDFVWAATGPALEAYSKHPVVRKVASPGELMTVSEFLGHVRRIVVDFVVGRVLSPAGDGNVAGGLDSVTAYYLLHRHDFGTDEAPIGACILYAVSCGLSDRDLLDKLDLIAHLSRTSDGNDLDDDSDPAEDDGDTASTSSVKLKPWSQRKRKSLGLDDGSGRPIPLIDQIHHLMQLWQAGSLADVNAYLDARGLRSSALFPRVLQAVVELAKPGSDERSLLETIAKHVRELGHVPQIDLPVA